MSANWFVLLHMRPPCSDLKRCHPIVAELDVISVLPDPWSKIFCWRLSCLTRLFALCGLFCFVWLDHVAAEQHYPETVHYVRPTAEGPDSEWRLADERGFFEARADFDGDDGLDVVRIARDEDDSSLHLFFFSVAGTGFVELAELDAQELPSLGVTVTPAGEYKTACGRGYWKCKPDERATLALRLPTITLFINEGKRTFFYWDQDVESFRPIVIIP